MRVVARYPGRCAVTDRPFESGRPIMKTPYGWVIDDAEGQAALSAIPGAPIHLEHGEGYGGRPYRVGQTLATWWWDGNDRREGIVTIVACRSRYYNEDGMSFGVGDEQGYVYEAWARLATPEEAAPILAARAAREARRQAKDHLRHAFAEPGVRPPKGTFTVAGRRYRDTSLPGPYGDLYADEYVVDSDQQIVWRVIYNGRDGDDWSLNNLPASIATRFPLTPEREAALAEAIAAQVLVPTDTTAADHDDPVAMRDARDE